VRALLSLSFLCLLCATASAGGGKKVKFAVWEPPDKCIVDRGGVDEEGDNNAGLSRRVVDAANVAEFLPNCETGVNFKKFRLVRVTMISNLRTAGSVKSVKNKGGKILVEVDTVPICTGHDVYRRSLLWVQIPKGKTRVQAVQGPIDPKHVCP
jgi:hypothetical protein